MQCCLKWSSVLPPLFRPGKLPLALSAFYFFDPKIHFRDGEEGTVEDSEGKCGQNCQLSSVEEGEKADSSDTTNNQEIEYLQGFAWSSLLCGSCLYLLMVALDNLIFVHFPVSSKIGSGSRPNIR